MPSHQQKKYCFRFNMCMWCVCLCEFQIDWGWMRKKNQFRDLTKFVCNPILWLYHRKWSQNFVKKQFFRALHLYAKLVFSPVDSVSTTHIDSGASKWKWYRLVSTSYGKRKKNHRSDFLIKKNILLRWSPYIVKKKCKRRKKNCA